ncbi:hypothetical protein PsorP6_018185 [Peronosclerospora sorghi]|uniref:Uncharacterized protein n=1 Tax=Peronosclerospora sorghi TaxID=230839 RepID=A0ACC0WEJ9_9STRA|nr:hypothetical protein PsorP6_018185 [Peronosclerospora sorghi]
MSSAPSASSPASSSSTSSFGGNDAMDKVPPRSVSVRPPRNATSTDDDSSATGHGTHGVGSAFGLMKARAATATKTLGPPWLQMKDKTSRRLEKYQPTLIVKATTSASSGVEMSTCFLYPCERKNTPTETLRIGLTTAASRVVDGSTHGWSLLKTKLAAAGPVAGKIQTLGLNVMTDFYHGDTTIDTLRYVENPKRASCLFLAHYKHRRCGTESASPAKALLRMSTLLATRGISLSNGQPVEHDTRAMSSPGDRCFATPYVLGTILLFCGDLPVLAHMSCVNKSCRDFIASERRVEKFCVRYGHLPSHLRFAYWEKTANVSKTRQTAEWDYDTYLQMGLSKRDATDAIRTDVQRTYGRVAPHKRAAKHTDQVAEEGLTTQLSAILHALAGRFPAVGYCQGMDYIAACVLNKVKTSRPARDAKAEAESAFWFLVTLFEHYGLREMFAPGLYMLYVHCFQTQRLLDVTTPRLATHFAREHVWIEMFAVGWFQTLYLYLNVLPLASLHWIWDVFVFEKSWKIMLRVALALLQLSEAYVMEKAIDEIMHFFNTFADEADEILAEASLAERALRLKVTNTVLSKLHTQYVKHRRTSGSSTR